VQSWSVCELLLGRTTFDDEVNVASEGGGGLHNDVRRPSQEWEVVHRYVREPCDAVNAVAKWLGNGKGRAVGAAATSDPTYLYRARHTACAQRGAVLGDAEPSEHQGFPYGVLTCGTHSAI
jgi:hypothetical protein